MIFKLWNNFIFLPLFNFYCSFLKLSSLYFMFFFYFNFLFQLICTFIILLNLLFHTYCSVGNSWITESPILLMRPVTMSNFFTHWKNSLTRCITVIRLDCIPRVARIIHLLKSVTILNMYWSRLLFYNICGYNITPIVLTNYFL